MVSGLRCQRRGHKAGARGALEAMPFTSCILELCHEDEGLFGRRLRLIGDAVVCEVQFAPPLPLAPLHLPREHLLRCRWLEPG